MLKPKYTTKFNRDLKRMKKSGKDFEKIKAVIRSICDEEPLAERHKDHALSGDRKGFRDCHIEPDWVLVHAVGDKEVSFARTGTHSEIFG